MTPRSVPRVSARPAWRAALLVVALSPAARPQDLWEQFAHPWASHDLSGGADTPQPPIAVPELLASPTAQVEVPALVVLLAFSDHVPAAPHTEAFYADMVFGAGGGPWSSMRPSVAETLRETSNGRLELTPAADTWGPSNGVVGWVVAQCPPGVGGPCDSSYYGGEIQKKRAEGVRRAEPFVDYAWFDDPVNGGDGDGLVTTDELLVFVVNTDPGCCDGHGAVGHTGPAGCTPCAGGNARQTDPEFVPVDGVGVWQLMPGLTEGAHADVYTHESGHSLLGLTDLYQDGNANPWVRVDDGYELYPPPSCGGECKLPFNDDCADAVPLGDGETAFGSTVNGSGSDLSSCAFDDIVDVWFTYRPAVSEDVTFSTCTSGSACALDTTLSVFDGCGGAELASACNDDFPCPSPDAGCEYRSSLTLPLQAGTTYWIRLSGWNGGTGNYVLSVDGGGGFAQHTESTWLPAPPGAYSLMASYPDGYLTHLDPWAKLHLGFLRPRVVTHDGIYTLHSAEPERSFEQQLVEPEALVVFDPLKATGFRDYFLLENRAIEPFGGGASALDSGLAIWRIDETPKAGESQLNLRRAVELARRTGAWTGDATALWDGDDPASYDWSASSSPEDSHWNDGSPSHVEVTQISAAGPLMTVHVRMTPLFVDAAATGPLFLGTAGFPWNDVAVAVEYVAAQDLDGDGVQDGPRTVRLQAGTYAGQVTIGAPVTLVSAGGSSVLGP